MNWLSLTIVAVGLVLYSLALLMKTTSLRRLRILRLPNLLLIRRRVPQPLRGWVSSALLAGSLLLIGFALWQTINIDRVAFTVVAIFGALLLAVRLLGFLFTHVSLILVDIQLDPGSRFNLAHLRRSPFILGGLVLVMLGAAVPGALDSILWARFHAFDRGQRILLDAWAKKSGVSEGAGGSYRERNLTVDGDSSSEKQFFSRYLAPGRRILIEGRAGIGKSWFLNKLRWDFRNSNPAKRVVFLDAKQDLRPDDEVLDDFSRAAFGDLAPVARPIAKKVLAQALIVIDGLDEAKNKFGASDAVWRFAHDADLGLDTLVVATRQFGHGLTKEAGFVQGYLSPLDEIASNDEINSRLNKLRGLRVDDVDLEQLRLCCLGKLQTLAVARGRLGQQPPAELRLFYASPVPDWPRIPPATLERMYRAFIGEFFSNRTVVDRGSWRESVLPFLSTYRDIDIVGELFLETITGELKAATIGEMRKALIERLITIRIIENYKSYPTPNDVRSQQELAERVIADLTRACAAYLRVAPQATTFKFTLDQLRRNFDGTTLDQVLLEGEVMSRGANGSFSFENPALDDYFLARARTKLSPETGTQP